MAVAAHVSRVAKEYAPHGYSIMADICREVSLEAGGGDATYVFLMPDDADIYVEDVRISSFGSVGAATDDTLSITVQSVDDAGWANAQQIAFRTFDSDEGGTALAAKTQESLTVTNPVVAQGKFLNVVLTEIGTLAEDAILDLQIRYRRKA
tara:strand:+ start:56 stop:508 length:453 start_codon:yes stop_codon:yes gene_type:complete